MNHADIAASAHPSSERREVKEAGHAVEGIRTRTIVAVKAQFPRPRLLTGVTEGLSPVFDKPYLRRPYSG